MSARLGIVIRTMGPQSTRDTILECARCAEDAGFDDDVDALLGKPSKHFGHQGHPALAGNGLFRNSDGHKMAFGG